MRANVTRAAEGFDRRSFTVAEILRMQDAGIIAEDENFELIEGEIVPTPAKTHVHELLKSALTMGVVRALPDPLWLGVEIDDLSQREHLRRTGSRRSIPKGSSSRR